MSNLTLQLPEAMVEDLADAARDAGQTPEQLAADMLKRMLAIRQFNRLQKDIRNSLGENAPKSEDEIFEQIS